MSLPAPNLDDRSWKQIVDEAVRLIPRYCPEWTNHAAALAAGDAKEPLFAGVQEVERFLYVGDDRLSAFNEEAAVDLSFDAMPGSSGPRVPTVTEWQYFDGKRWREMTLNRNESDQHRLSFGRHVGIEKQIVNGVETFWVRGKLAEPLKDPRQVMLDSISLRIEILGEGMAPESAFVNIGSYIFLPVDQGKSFHPFGEEPKFDCALYVGHKELFAAPEARIRIEATLVEPSVVVSPEASPDLMVHWEYWNGRKWAELGRTGGMGVSGPQGNFNFLDSTGAFTRNGAVQFDRPADMVETEVGGQKNLWVRARINSGNYGAPGSYELVGQNWVFKEDRPLRPPCLKTLVFKYVREPKPVQYCQSYNDFQYRDHTDDLNTPYVYFQPFLPDQDETPAFYLGFDARFPQQAIHLYFELDDVAAGGGEQLGGSAPGALEEDLVQKGPRVVWEHWDGVRWADLLPQDRTYGFTRSGYLTFNGPRNFEKRSVFDSEAWWLRARLESGSYDLAPVLRAVLVNAVDAINGVTVKEVLGSSDGSIDQSFTLANSPILAGPQVWVLEPDAPTTADRKTILSEEGPEPIAPDADGTGTWVRWHEVENFFDRQPGSRHYLCDPIKGELTFGDGRKGWVPPVARDSIKCEYRLGGGVAGNVGANTLTVLKQSIAFVQSVTNPFAAQGGADPESIEEAKRRGTFAIKNRDRAITAEDYESLALAASRRVARAKCVQASDGSISLLLVPKAERGNGDARAIPSRDLIDRVASYIDKRRLITARVNVGKPKLMPVSLELTISLKAGANADRGKAYVKEKVKTLLNPLHGGPKGEGWPFGRAVGKADLYPVVEGVDGVDRIADLMIIDESRRLRVEMLKLAEDELPQLIGVEIYDRG